MFHSLLLYVECLWLQQAYQKRKLEGLPTCHSKQRPGLEESMSSKDSILSSFVFCLGTLLFFLLTDTYILKHGWSIMWPLHHEWIIFLHCVAPGSFLLCLCKWCNKVLPRIYSASKSLTTGFWSHLYLGRSMAHGSSEFIWSQLQEEQHIVFTPLTLVKLVCLSIHANKFRICS